MSCYFKGARTHVPVSATSAESIRGCGVVVIPSITRSVWEPPALEVLDHCEGASDGGFSFNLNDDGWKDV